MIIAVSRERDEGSLFWLEVVPGYFHFPVVHWTLKVKDSRRHRLLFSERQSGVHIGPIAIFAGRAVR